MDTDLRINFTEFYKKAKKIASKIEFKGATLNLPFISINIDADLNEKKIAKEIIIRLRDKRVLNTKECCDNCIENSLKSLIEIREFLVNKEVEIGNIESPLFLLVDFGLMGIKKFLTFTEFYKPEENQEEYFNSLNTIRGHLLRVFDGINQIAELPEEFGFRYEFNSNWDDQIYFIDENLII